VLELLKSESGIQLDLGGGAHPQHGFLNIDIRDLPEVDIVHDLTKFPWPLPDECCLRVMAAHLVEHINPANFAFVKFMDEVWRITRPGGEFMISMPYGYSPGFIQDPTHCNPCNETTWAYFDPLHVSQLWTIYKPKPWYYRYVSFDPMWNMEVFLLKHSGVQEKWEEEREEWGPMTFE
jgi:SAM-dependent methyltransferase